MGSECKRLRPHVGPLSLTSTPFHPFLLLLPDWGYINTDGLGLIEYLEWTEDLGVTGIMGVFAGEGSLLL